MVIGYVADRRKHKLTLTTKFIFYHLVGNKHSHPDGKISEHLKELIIENRLKNKDAFVIIFIDFSHSLTFKRSKRGSNLMKIFIDLGAFTGDTLRIALDKYKDFDKFYAFEPFSKNFELLKKGFANKENVVLYQAAADVRSGKSKLYLQNDPKLYSNTGHSLFAKKSNVLEDTFEIVNSLNFSKFITDKFNISDTIVLKIDIEGMEYDLLAKMIQDESIKYINKIFCEWHPTRAKIGKKRHNEIISQLKGWGFNLSGANKDDDFSRVMKESDKVRKGDRRRGN